MLRVFQRVGNREATWSAAVLCRFGWEVAQCKRNYETPHQPPIMPSATYLKERASRRLLCDRAELLFAFGARGAFQMVKTDIVHGSAVDAVSLRDNAQYDGARAQSVH